MGSKEAAEKAKVLLEARLVLTDELIRDTLRRTKKAMSGRSETRSPAPGAPDAGPGQVASKGPDAGDPD